MAPPVAICWFRRDLRLDDNPAWNAAARAGLVLPVYVLDPDEGGDLRPGAASRVWLHHSLTALQVSLGGRLLVAKGDPVKVLPDLAARFGASLVCRNRIYEVRAHCRDQQVDAALQGQQVTSKAFHSGLLWDPDKAVKDDNTPWRVFTPFWRNRLLKAGPPSAPQSPIQADIHPEAPGDSIDALGLLPAHSWHRQMIDGHWQPGEAGAMHRLDRFLETGLDSYARGRDFPALRRISRLSPHLHFGEISPNRIWHSVMMQERGPGTEAFLRELAWREFSAGLLWHFPHMAHRNFKPEFDHFPWRHDATLLSAWQRGETGYPLVDAGMRELWETGFMHNRVRMIVASFLTKNLLIDWRLGEAWFRDCLVDWDLANNVASWQWVAGSGADAAPFFRIFNPETQARKFDPDNHYIQRWLPNGTVAPIIDLRESRARALAVWKKLKHS